MENLTKSASLVVFLDDPRPHPGHSRVVYEQSASGRSLRAILGPEEKLERSWRDLGKKFVVYGVPTGTDRLLEWRVHQLTHDQVHSVYLDLCVEYRIGKPRTLVEALSMDPLARLKQHVERVVRRAIKRIEWSTIEEEPVDLEVLFFEEGVDPEARLDELQEFASGYGLDLRRVRLERYLPDEEVEVKRFDLAHSRNRSMQRAEQPTRRLRQSNELELEARQKSFERHERFDDEVATHTGRAVGQIADGVRTVAGLQAMNRGLRSLATPPGVDRLPGPEAKAVAAADPSLLSAGAIDAEPAPSSEAEDPRTALVADIRAFAGTLQDPSLGIRVEAKLLSLLAETLNREASEEEGEVSDPSLEFTVDLPSEQLQELRTLAERIRKVGRGTIREAASP